jgi:NADPH2:quinone reductase
MRAMWLREFGGPEMLVAADTPDPVPGPGQVLIEVEFANITFVETQVRAGKGPFPVTLPMIPGNGVGGGRVIASTGGSGGYASRVAVDASALIPVPDGVALDAAVALLADGRTAMSLMAAVAPASGERVLVEAAAGGVGTLLVQLARAAGATVVAAAGGPRKLDVARDLGADVVVDYRSPDWTDRVREAVGGLDVVFDGVGGDIGRAAHSLLARGGRMVRFGLASGAWADVPDDALVRMPPASPERLRAFTRAALAEAAAGRLRPVIGQRFPLERAADAHAAIESRATIGKTLLTVR